MEEKTRVTFCVCEVYRLLPNKSDNVDRLVSEASLGTESRWLSLETLSAQVPKGLYLIKALVRSEVRVRIVAPMVMFYKIISSQYDIIFLDRIE